MFTPYVVNLLIVVFTLALGLMLGRTVGIGRRDQLANDVRELKAELTARPEPIPAEAHDMEEISA